MFVGHWTARTGVRRVRRNHASPTDSRRGERDLPRAGSCGDSSHRSGSGRRALAPRHGRPERGRVQRNVRRTRLGRDGRALSPDSERRGRCRGWHRDVVDRTAGDPNSRQPGRGRRAPSGGHVSRLGRGRHRRGGWNCVDCPRRPDHRRPRRQRHRRGGRVRDHREPHGGRLALSHRGYLRYRPFYDYRRRPRRKRRLRGRFGRPVALERARRSGAGSGDLGCRIPTRAPAPTSTSASTRFKRGSRPPSGPWSRASWTADRISSEGRCLYGSAIWCSDARLVGDHCASGIQCGWDPRQAGFRCVDPASGPCEGVRSVGTCRDGAALSCTKGGPQ